MKLMCSLLLLLFVTNAFALHVSQFNPQGNDVDSGSEIKVQFDSDIIELGKLSEKVKAEQIAKISIKPDVKCEWKYADTKSVACVPSEKLVPASEYTVKIDSGFQGLTIDNRTSSDQTFKFKINDLSVLSYKVNWTSVSLNGEVILNYAIKPEGLSGTIQCDSQNFPVTLSLASQGKIQVVNFKTESKALEKKSSCVFYFNKPITLLRYPIKSVPREKVVLSKEIPQVLSPNFNPNHVRKYYAYCEGTRWDRRTEIVSYQIPQVTCEYNDYFQVDIGLRNTDVEKYVKVTPAHSVKVDTSSGYLRITGFRPQATYIVAISKEASPELKGNLVVQLDAIDSPPLLGSNKQNGVIEKDGPWQVPYSALNIKSLDVRYTILDSVSELSNSQMMKGEHSEMDQSTVIKLDLPVNENTLLPLNLKDLTKKHDFKAGYIRGHMEVKDVDPKFLESEALLVETEYSSYRKAFNFGFLVTDIGLHMKVAQKGVLIWATSLKTGKPLKDVVIKLTHGGGDVNELKTNSNGLAYFEDVMNKHVTAVATLGDDISVISADNFWSRGISLYDFNLRNYYYDEDGRHNNNRVVADVVAERPLYLPDEDVELKFFVRKDGVDELEYESAGKSINLIVHDSRGEEIYKNSVALNNYGTAAIKFKLEPKAATGDYTVFMTVDGDSVTFNKAFSVQEFRKPEIKVAMSETDKAYTGKVTYYSGGDMKDAEGQVALIFKASKFKPKDPNLKRFSYPKEVGGQYYDWEDYYSYESEPAPEVLSREEITTNEKGGFEIQKSEVLQKIHKYGNLVVEAIFKDSAGGSVAGRVSTLVNPYKHIPGIELTEWYYTAGTKINPRVVAIGSDGKPALNVKMELEVKLINWIYERRLGSGNYFYYDSRKEEKVVKECKFQTTANYDSCDVKLDEGGSYTFTVKVRGEHGLSPAGVSTYVMKENSYYGYKMENHDRINVRAENNELKLGDKVRIMAMAPFTDGEALITFERDGILHREQVPFKGNVILYEKEIKDEKFVPGFFASIVVVKGRTSDKIEGEIDLGKPQFKIGYTRIEVANLPKRLATSVTPSAPQVKPGEMMEVSINVKDYKGKGVKSELAIAVVDDSLLSLAGNYRENYDILDTFYALKNPLVDNYQTLTQLIGRRTYGKKGANPGGGGGFALRSDFKNTAYWIAQVETDEKGNHKFKFKLPDNLTTWKVIAVSVDEKHRFGYGEGEFLATKPLTVEPVLPNFLMEGDKFLAQVSVANRSGEDQEVLVTPMSKTLKINKTEEKIKITNGNRSSVVFPIEAGLEQKADLAFTATAGKHKDGFQVSIPVEKQTILNVNYVNGVVGEKAVTIPLALPADARKESLNLAFEYSNTVMNGLDEVFRYAVGYPYGCWEQRLTKAYFLVQYEQFKDIITYRFTENQGSIKSAVQGLLDLAPDYQTSSGGMRYYPGGENYPDIYLSVFTAYSFNMMKKVGYTINPQVESALKSYLRNLVQSDSGWSSDYGGFRNPNKALILNVLAEMGETNLNSVGSKLYSERNSLDLFGLSFLGGYLHSSKGFENEAKNIFQKLDSLKETYPGMISFKEPNKTSDDWKWWNYTDTRSQCAVLQNLATYSNDKTMVANLVRTILSRMKGGHWYNTQENIYCFEGLRKFVQKFEKNVGDGDLVVKLDGKEVDKSPDKKENVRRINLVPSDLEKIPAKAELKSSDKDELYYATIMRFETPYKERAPTNGGISLHKTIYKKNGDQFVELKGSPIKIKRGDQLKIVLNVKTPATRYQVMLNDRLAGCFEPINMNLATSSQADGTAVKDQEANTADSDSDEEYYSPWFKGDGFEYMDLRLNAAQFYSRKLPAGDYTVEYLVQVRTAGEFTLPESTVEEMYYPEIRGTYSGKKVIVAE